MIKFLFKGLIRDRARSFFPLIIITSIVAIIIFFSGFLNGIYNSLFFNMNDDVSVANLLLNL